MTSKATFKKLVTLLEKGKVPCKVKYDDREYIIELGFDFPEKLVDKVSKIVDKLKLERNTFSICGRSSVKPIEYSKINGGPQEYFRGKSMGPTLD